MKVLKFGTSALATSQKFNQSVRLAGSTKDSIVVLSALAGTTEKLEEISEYLYKKNPEGANECINSFEQEYKQIISELFASEQYKSEAINFVKDRIAYIRSFSKDLFTLFEEKIVLAQGEILSSGLFTLKLKESGVNVKEIPALDFMRIDKKNEPDTSYIEENLNRLLSENKDADLYVTQGYICRNAYGEIDNFDFGGSDYTAALTGAAVGAGEIQIWTDVDVLYGKNSNLISNSQTVRHINFDEAAELAYFGAKILHPRCILPAKLGNIPVRLLSLDATGSEGTLISNETEKNKIKAVASKDGIIAVNIKSSRMLLAHGFLRRVTEIFEKHQTSIDMLTTSEVGVSITIDNPKYLAEITDELKKLGIVSIKQNMTIVSVVGDLEESSESPMPKVLEAIKQLPLKMISYGGSNCNISFIIDAKDKDKTLQLLNKNIF